MVFMLGVANTAFMLKVVKLNVVAPSFLSSRCQSHFYFALNVMDAMNE
jgi:hypothetical protein